MPFQLHSKLGTGINYRECGFYSICMSISLQRLFITCSHWKDVVNFLDNWMPMVLSSHRWGNLDKKTLQIWNSLIVYTAIHPSINKLWAPHSHNQVLFSLKTSVTHLFWQFSLDTAIITNRRWLVERLLLPVSRSKQFSPNACYLPSCDYWSDMIIRRELLWFWNWK